VLQKGSGHVSFLNLHTRARHAHSRQNITLSFAETRMMHADAGQMDDAGSSLLLLLASGR